MWNIYGVRHVEQVTTAKRLGGVVEAYDVRPAAREQILSVGAKPVELDLETDTAEDKGGYAKEQSAEFIARQQEQLTQVIDFNSGAPTTLVVGLDV